MSVERDELLSIVVTRTTVLACIARESIMNQSISSMFADCFCNDETSCASVPVIMRVLLELREDGLIEYKFFRWRATDAGRAASSQGLEAKS